MHFLNKHHSIISLGVTVISILFCIVALIFLYLWSPQDFLWFPKCPFLSLTGYKCPGCGSLRAMHALLHFHFIEAIKLNPLMIISIPIILSLLLSNKIRFSRFTGKFILIITLSWWIFRNLTF